MSLGGRRVLVTRAREQADTFVAAIEAAGGEAIVVPVIDRSFDVDPAPIDDALAAPFDALVITSVNAAEAVARRGGRWTAPVYCVGPKTAAALDREVFAGEVVTPEDDFRAESVVAAIRARWPEGGRRVVVPRGAHGRELLVEALTAGGFTVDAPIVYAIAPRRWSREEVTEAGAAEIATFLSGKTLEAFLAAFDDARAFLAARTVAVIGPVAADAARALGVVVDVVPAEATVEALVAALAD